MSSIQDFIKPELLILIPVLYFIGLGLKKSSTEMDKHIPLVLGFSGVVLATLYVVAASEIHCINDMFQAVFVGITQGVLCAGCSVYANQVVKQEHERKE